AHCGQRNRVRARCLSQSHRRRQRRCGAPRRQPMRWCRRGPADRCAIRGVPSVGVFSLRDVGGVLSRQHARRGERAEHRIRRIPRRAPDAVRSRAGRRLRGSGRRSGASGRAGPRHRGRPGVAHRDMTAAVSPSVHERFTGALDLLARKVAEDERVLGIEFPHVTAPDGRWQTYPASWSAGYTGSAWSHGHWTCGFWVGLLIAAHLHTGDARYLVWARERMRLVAQRADDPNTHDIGFIFDGSAIPAYHVTGDTWYADIALRTAERLRARLIPTHSGAYLSSWGPVTDERARTSSAIDTMANLPLLVWAAQYSGDGSFLYAAQAHASKTAEAFIRPDDSTYHAVQY